jgi:tRNA G18 (ribose-2'-O)-methylase SpoU
MRKLKLKELGRKSVPELKESNKLPIVLVLDNIRSAMNVGSFFRTSDAFALEKIYLCCITATPPHKEINKTAIGATDSVEWKYFKTTRECLKVLKNEEYIITGIEQTDKSISLEKYTPDKNKKHALIFGNEVNGISDDILDILDLALEIPQFGTKHSFKVAVSGGITLWHYFLNIS